MKYLSVVLICLVAVSALAETRTEGNVLSGFVEIIVEDYLREGSRTEGPQFYSITRHYLEVKGERIELTGTEFPTELRTGEHLTLEGEFEGEAFRVDNIVSIAPGKLNGKAPGLFSGAQNLIVIPMQLENVPFAPACTWDAINDMAFDNANSLANWWDEVSHGNLWFDPEVSFTHPVITIPSTYNGNCSAMTSTWTSQANQIVGTELLNTYNRRVYVIPNSLGNCPLGLGQIGNPAMSVTLNWVRGCNYPDTFQHEMGHNFSLRHANTPGQEYADTGDIMGFATGSIRKINGPHTEDLGWLDQVEPYYITLAGVGVHEVTLLALGRDYVSNPQTQIIKIPAPGFGTVYVSYRDRHGMDAQLGTAYDFETHVHTSQGTESYLHATLNDNQSFTVPGLDIAIRQLSHNTTDGTALVRVTIETPTDCTEAVPLVRLASQQPDYTVPGGSVEYRVEVTNNDGPTCNPVEFRITSTLPGQLWSSNSPVTLQLAPGQTGVSPALVINSPESATSPRYFLNMAVLVDEDIENEHTALLRDVEFRIDNFPPSPPNISMDIVDGTPMLNWADSTDSQSGVGQYEIYMSPGTMDFEQFGTTVFNFAEASPFSPAQMLWFQVLAVDNVGNKSD